MVDMNDVSLRNNNPVDIDLDDVLRDLGLDNIPQTSTVVQQGDTIINIPNNSPLEPPAIISDASDNDFATIVDELFESQEALDAVRSVNEGDYPSENPDEELLNDGNNDSYDTQNNISDNEVRYESVEREEISSDTEETENTSDETSTTSDTDTIEELLGASAVEKDKGLLPVNSKSHEIDETTSRFSGAAWYKAIQESTIILAGLGGIGSYILFCLSRMKPRQVFIYDDDIVEQANLSGQLYSMSMIGKHKVNAMADLAKDFSNYCGVQAIPQKFTSETAAGDIMICGFDNMDARKIFFNSWREHVEKHPNPEKCLFLDGRLSLEEFQVFCMTGDCKFDIQRYTKNYLFDSWEAESTLCSMKQTTYCANMIGSVMVNLFTNFIANSLSPIVKRDLPFKTWYDASMMYLKTEI